MDNMIGQRIKDRRIELQLTQSYIQKNTSISSGNLSCIENGKYLPSATALIELSQILDCSIDWILTGNSKISNITDPLDILDSNEKKLLLYFQKMSSSDKEEFLMIAQIKANKGKRKEGSTLSERDNTTSGIA